MSPSGSARLGSPTSPRRDQVVTSPLRSAFVEQRDQLFFKFGMKLEHVRRRYEQRIQPLAVVSFNEWGTTTPADLPPQLGVMLNLTEVVQFVIPHILSPPTVQAYASTFMKLLTEFPPYVALLKDMFWYFFLEFFLLSESEERLDRYRIELLEKLRSEQPTGQSKKRRHDNNGPSRNSKAPSAAASPSHGNRGGGGGATDDTGGGTGNGTFPTPAINGSHPLWKQRLSMHCKQMRVDDVNKRKSTLPPPKPISELLIDDEDDDLFDANAGITQPALPMIGITASSSERGGRGGVPQNLANPSVIAHEQQERRKQDFIRKLKRRQLSLLPGHVLSTQEAYQFKYSGVSTAPTQANINAKKSSGGATTPRPTTSSSSTSAMTGRVPSPTTSSSARRGGHSRGQGSRGVPDDVTAIIPYDVEDDTSSPHHATDQHDDWERASVGSGWSVASMPTSAISDDAASDGDSAHSTSPRPYSRGGRRSPLSGTGDLIALADRCRVKGKRRLVRGEKNFAQSLAVLLEAEELELTLEQLASLKEEVASRSPEGLGKEMAVITLACDLIQREQSRMFGRMARNHVNAVRELKEHIRAVVAPSMADVMARVVTQLLYLACPYSRALLTRRTRKVIKRKISYWIGGIEKAEVDSWGDGVAVHMDSAHKTDMHAYHVRRWAGAAGVAGGGATSSSPGGNPGSGTVSPLSGSISSPPAPRTTRRASLRIPQPPSLSDPQQQRPNAKFSVNLDDSSSSMVGSLNGSLRQPGPPLRRISSSLMAPSPTGSLRGRRAVVGFQGAPPNPPASGSLQQDPSTPSSVAGLPQLSTNANDTTSNNAAGVAGGATTVAGSTTPLDQPVVANEFVSLSSTFSWSAGAVAYHKALDEILDDFEKMQQQSAESSAGGGGNGGQGAQRFLGKGGRGGTANATASSARGAGGSAGNNKKKGGGKASSAEPADDTKKHLETHRHSSLNRRAELWHEQGRASHAVVNSEARTRRGFFDLGCVSPFMKRYLRDGGSASGAQDARHSTASRLIKWTSS